MFDKLNLANRFEINSYWLPLLHDVELMFVTWHQALSLSLLVHVEKMGNPGDEDSTCERQDYVHVRSYHMVDYVINMAHTITRLASAATKSNHESRGLAWLVTKTTRYTVHKLTHLVDLLCTYTGNNMFTTNVGTELAKKFHSIRQNVTRSHLVDGVWKCVAWVIAAKFTGYNTHVHNRYGIRNVVLHLTTVIQPH